MNKDYCDFLKRSEINIWDKSCCHFCKATNRTCVARLEYPWYVNKRNQRWYNLKGEEK